MWSDTGTSDNRNVEWEIYCTHVWVDATCTEDEYCSICGMTRNPALGHDFIDHSDLTSEYFYCGATCITKETYYQKCSRCGARGTNTFTVGDYGNHYWQYTGSSPATCTSSGYTSYTCAYCGDNDYDTIPATGHDTYVTTRAATCTVGGASTTRCHNCGWQSTTTTSALGHDWETATINGITTSKCRRCGATRGSGHT